MSEIQPSSRRWGSEGRDRKGSAILRTSTSRFGEQIADGTWVDIGCGSGGIATELAPSVRTIVGVDPESWSEWAGSSAAHANLSFQTAACDIGELSITSGTADVVICNQVHEQVRHPEQLIHNINRTITLGGYCCFAEPNLLWPVVHRLLRAAAHALRRLPGSAQAAELDECYATFWHLHHWFDKTGRSRRGACSSLRGYGALARITRTCSRGVLALLAPRMPAFVFTLRKT